MRTIRPKRDTDSKHLALIRQCPCVSCHRDPAGEAAHVRMTVDGKPITGISIKPADRFVTPLCRNCHRAQHQIGELAFWANAELDPLKIASQLFELSPNLEAMRKFCLVAPVWQKHREGK